MFYIRLYSINWENRYIYFYLNIFIYESIPEATFCVNCKLCWGKKWEEMEI